jgi:hypothetical protein
MLQGLKMKKLLLVSLLFAAVSCGTEEMAQQQEVFTAEVLTISKTELCENLDASVKEDMDAAALTELCGIESTCTEFEIELECNGEWCVTHRTCRLKE